MLAILFYLFQIIELVNFLALDDLNVYIFFDAKEFCKLDSFTCWNKTTRG